MQGSPSRCELGQATFDGRMDVLVRVVEIELSFVELALDAAKATLDGCESGPGQKARGVKPARVGDAARDVIGIQLEIGLQRR